MSGCNGMSRGGGRAHAHEGEEEESDSEERRVQRDVRQLTRGWRRRRSWEQECD